MSLARKSLVLNGHPRSPAERWTDLADRHPARQKSIHRNRSRSEDQDNDRRDQKSKRSRAHELVWIRKNGEQRFAVGRDIGYKHIDDERQRNQARSEPQKEKQATRKFET